MRDKSQNETGEDLKSGEGGKKINHCKDNEVHQNNEQLLSEVAKPLFLV